MKKFITALIAASGNAFALFGVDVSVGGYMQEPSGNLKYKGSAIDIDKDLNLDREIRPYARLKLEPPVPLIPKLYAQYTPTKFEGKKTLTKNITYGNRTFTQGTPIDSSVELNRYDLAVFYNVPLVGLATLGTIDPEFGLNMRLVQFDGKITNRNNPTVSESKSFSVPIPMVYASLGISPPGIPLEVRAEARAMPVKKLRYYDFSGEVRIKPLVPFYISLGYRQETFNLEDIKDVYTDFTIKGPFLMIGARF
ncbi:MAG: TIGR04219 family outer membrane beta-barrel protein [Aquificaceae bacterium]|nr:TIGR04219 family outer membrane beta-barrel protein [Aquificaceae bacterium]